MWPDLAYRTRRAGVRKVPAAEAAEPKFGDVLVALLGKVMEENVSTDREMTEDQYVVHLKECATCRKNVAAFARMGVKIPSRILVAAGVEVLN
jgi:hypothetical protein